MCVFQHMILANMAVFTEWVFLHVFQRMMYRNVAVWTIVSFCWEAGPCLFTIVHLATDNRVFWLGFGSLSWPFLFVGLSEFWASRLDYLGLFLLHISVDDDCFIKLWLGSVRLTVHSSHQTVTMLNIAWRDKKRCGTVQMIATHTVTVIQSAHNNSFEVFIYVICMKFTFKRVRTATLFDKWVNLFYTLQVMWWSSNYFFQLSKLAALQHRLVCRLDLGVYRTVGVRIIIGFVHPCPCQNGWMLGRLRWRIDEACAPTRLKKVQVVLHPENLIHSEAFLPVSSLMFQTWIRGE